jgi:transcriptional regulator with XRE-family HTH domain
MGRKAGITHNEQRLRASLAAALRYKFRNERGAATKAAGLTGITRQAISLYMREKATPSSETLRLLCTTLNMKLDIEGAIVSPTGAEPVNPAAPEQMNLFEAISAVQDQQLKVEILNRGEQSMELKVSISFVRKEE